jgi:hypothetical protein
MKLNQWAWGGVVRFLCLVIAGAVLISCTSTIQKDKEKVLNEILRKQQNAPAQATNNVPVESVEQPQGESVEQPQGESVEQPPVENVAKQPVGIEKANLPPALPRSTRLNLPLPRGTSHADLLHFFNAYSSVMQAYKPFEKEWQIFIGMFSKEAQLGADEFLQFRVRVRENPDRTHWLFVWGVFDTSKALLNGKRTADLLVDRQQDFIVRMRTLVYLMSELELAGMKANYREFLRNFYKNVSSKYFKRVLKDRPSKPRSLIAP